MTLDEETDADLVLRARNGDDRAFTRLMRRHNPPLYGFVRRYIADADAAVDVVQALMRSDVFPHPDRAGNPDNPYVTGYQWLQIIGGYAREAAEAARKEPTP